MDYKKDFISKIEMFELDESGKRINTIVEDNMLKIGVIGSRGFNDYKLVCDTLNPYKNIVYQIVSGGAKGADSLGEKWANENHIKTLIHRPDWDKHGKAAGFIRNELIVDDSNLIISFWDGMSRGSEHSMNLAKDQGKEVIIIYFNKIF